MCLRDDSPVLFERFQLRENTEYFVDVTLPISKNDAERLAAGGRTWPFNDRLTSVFLSDPVRRWRETPGGNVVVSGVLRLRNHAGILDLRTDFGTVLVAEVVCRKINYLNEFQSLLNEVAAELAELLLQYESPVSVEFDTSDVSSTNDAGQLFQLRHIMSPGNLPAAIEEVLSSFHGRLMEQARHEQIGAVVEPDIASLIDGLDVSSLDRGGPLARLFRGHTPRELAVEERYETVDTPENRYVKSFLEECGSLVERLAHKLEGRQKSAAVREVRGWAEQIDEMLGQRLWEDVGPLRHFPSNSQILQKRRGYREVLRFDMALRLGLLLSWRRGDGFAEGFLGDIRPVNEIYEYWCFFVLRRLLRDLCAEELPRKGTFVAIAPDGLQVRLERGKRSRVCFRYANGGPRTLEVCLFYNRRFRRPTKKLATWDGSYSAFFHPDYSLLLTVDDDGSKRRHWVHFDAKYRMEPADAAALFASKEIAVPADDDEDAEYEREIERLHRRDDLFKMHTYRDGILSSRGAYILFPGDGTGVRLSGKQQNLFVRHPSAFGGAAIAFRVLALLISARGATPSKQRRSENSCAGSST
jgi:predicted component of viral defense system (DUF524 family)